MYCTNTYYVYLFECGQVLVSTVGACGSQELLDPRGTEVAGDCEVLDMGARIELGSSASARNH